jgi:hypothetical protein
MALASVWSVTVVDLMPITTSAKNVLVTEHALCATAADWSDVTLKFKDYNQAAIEEVEGTYGGKTYIVNGEPLCFNFTKQHYNAVSALLGSPPFRRNKPMRAEDIKDYVVERLLGQGVIDIDETDCVDGVAWYGCKVWDEDNKFIGEVGLRCEKAAGWDTDHPGQGRCNGHGGAKVDKKALARIKHGGTSGVLRRRIEDKVKLYLDGPNPLDLSRELAVSRALLDEQIEQLIARGDAEAFLKEAPAILSSMERVGRQVARIVSIEQKYALTASQVMYVQQSVIECIQRFIDDPDKRQEAADFIVSRLGLQGVQTTSLEIR